MTQGGMAVSVRPIILSTVPHAPEQPGGRGGENEGGTSCFEGAGWGA